MEETILILDFGAQYTQLIARRVRELNVYCEIHPYNHAKLALKNFINLKGIILSGSPFSVNDKHAPEVDLNQLNVKAPVLGICYGAQLIASQRGGKVDRSNFREFGRAEISIIKPDDKLMFGLQPRSQVWMSHGDSIVKLPPDATVTASTKSIEIAAFTIRNKDIYGIQFHPEVYHTEEGTKILSNFILNICGCRQNWTPLSFIETKVKELKKAIKNDEVILGLSGGVDSTVAAVLLNKAIGKNLHCLFVNNGLLRKNEFETVLHSYKDMGLNVTGINAKDKFYSALAGVKDPEKKRKAIGRAFIEVFNEEAAKHKNVKWLAQGTIYPDVIESISVKGPSSTIKSHHNVGGLPENMHLKIVEPAYIIQR